MSAATIQTELDRGVLLVTLDRPARLNAFNADMQRELIAALRTADEDDDVAAIVVTGAGRAFCAGADLSAGRQSFSYDAPPEQHRDGGGLLALEIFRLRKPILAAINGPAVGVGITMTLPMDVRLAAESARMGFVFTRRGLVPEGCSSYFLPRVVGIGRALEWVLSGRVFPAQEALDGGLVSRVLPDDELLPATLALAREITENTAPVSVALSRQMLWRMLGADHPMVAHRIESLGIRHRGTSGDAAEGIQSFLEKRPPRFAQRLGTGLPPYFPWWQDPPFRE